MISTEEIIATVERRRRDRYPVLEAMRAVQSAYNGEIVIPLPEMDRDEASSVANIVLNGLEQTAMRVASIMPDLDCPPGKPGSRRSEDRAELRRMATLSWWEQVRMPLKLRRRARWLAGYGCSPVIVRPDYTAMRPTWQIRDPLEAYPAPVSDPDSITPENCVFVHKQPFWWILQRFPDKAYEVAGGRNLVDVDLDEKIEVYEWFDGESLVLVAVGQGSNPFTTTYTPAVGGRASTGGYSRLAEFANRTDGLCPVVFPSRITLDRPMGQFDDMIGIYKTQSKLMALQLIAVERGVFPDAYLVSRPGETAKFEAGPFEGRTGEVNIISGGEFRESVPNPNFANTQAIDTLERNSRVNSFTPPDFSGESGTNIRTGRRAGQLLSSAVDFNIAELQELLAASLEEEHVRAYLIARNHFGTTRRSFYYKAEGTAVDYLPVRDFDTTANRVSYGQAGTDANTYVVGMGQRMGLGMVSRKTAMAKDPWVTDAVQEELKVTAQQIKDALVASIAQQGAAGAIPPADLARISELVEGGMELGAAVTTVNREAQERQASSGPPGTPTGPVPAGAPEAQPGLAQPGVGAEAPSAPPANLEAFLATLRGIA